MIYITGDKHRDFKKTAVFCDTVQSAKDDLLIILGNVGINYFGGEKDRAFKRLLAELPITFFCIHGNHERRPETLGYAEATRYNGAIYWEPEFPNLLFAKDGECYNLDGKRCITIGGSYSVDKEIHLAEGWGWWADEQPSKEIRECVENRLDAENWQVDYVLSHTAPLKYEPCETFISGVNQNTVDKSTEKWMDSIEGRLVYKRWYCGHYHTDKVIDKMRFLYNDFLEVKP